MVHHVPKKYRKLFQDSIVVTIPLNCAADLGVAIRHTREKRIKALQREFPSLKRESKNKSSPELELSAGDNGTADEEEDEKDRSMNQSKKSRPGVMQREQYGSVVDYLEAKYCRGVMLQDDNDDEDDDDDEKGSVYESDNSFVDDSLLKRDVAGQVLSQATHTKLELQNDDGDFFVNVGNLEVEDNDFMDYDPLVDDEKDKKAAAKRKRSKSTDSKGASKKPKAKKEGTKKPKTDAASKEGGTSDDDEAQVAVAASAASGSDAAEVAVDLSALQKIAAEQKAQKDILYDRIAEMAKSMSHENFPRKKLTVKMSIMIPEDKGPGDRIAFTNPHAPDQKMAAQIPENKGPGDKLFVHVAVPPPSDVTENKFPRDFQDLIADYAAAYDDWCDLEAKYHEADPEKKGKFKIKQAKMAKFDELLEAFPNDDLVVPVDGEELKKILRRVRQKRAKHKKREEETGEKADDAASAKEEAEDSKPPAVKKSKIEVKPLPKQKLKKRPSLPEKDDDESSKPAAKPKAAAKPKPAVAAKPKVAAAAKKPKAAPKPRPPVGPSETISVRVPGKGTVFPEIEMGSVEEFG